MKQGKETKTKDTPDRDPQVSAFSYDEFFNNRLSLTDALKEFLKGQGLDWRFINAAQFRGAGNVHRSHWKPYRIEDADAKRIGVEGMTVEGIVQRGDLVLAVRPKTISNKHKEFLAQRNAALAGYNKSTSKELKDRAREAGIGEQVRVHEGYEENE